MMKFKKLSVLQVIGMAVSMSIAIPAFAESAPVFDADAIQQQFDNSNSAAEQSQPDVLPPAPEQQGTFVPEQQAAAPVAQGGDLVARLEDLQSQVQTLRGQVEQLSHQLEKAQEQQKTQYVDLDKRLSDVSKSNKQKSSGMTDEVGLSATSASSQTVADKPARKMTSAKELAKETADAMTAADKPAIKPVVEKTSSDASTVTGGDQPNVAEEQQIYQSAYTLIKAKKYNDAVTVLQDMLRKYPSGQFASNAHYWLGELFGLLNKNDQALTEFNTVVKSYPNSPRVSDAQLKVGLIYASQSKWKDAKLALKSVVNHYPGTSSSKLATEQLSAIKQAGH